jgi:tyrosyl-tRNA synthetase
MVHGEKAARDSGEASRAAFGGGEAAGMSGVPSMEITPAELSKGVNVVDLFTRAGLCATKSDARRLVSQGGAYVNRRNVTDIDAEITADMAEDGALLLRAGKKRYFRVVVK